MPRADIAFGTQALPRLPELIVQSREGKPGSLVVDVEEPYDAFSADLPQRRAHAWRAWVPIMYGCNNFCTYCIVPYVRGRERSRSSRSILAEIARVRANGAREIYLLGQNVNSYGHDLGGEPSFAELLREVALTGVERVRFTSSHPKDLTMETLDAMAEEPAIMPHLHLAAQSGSDRILEAMGRRYRKDDYLALAREAHARVPGIALTTDLIVGFPGETEEDFQATLDLVDEADLQGAYTFIYSKREGTRAARMPNQVPSEIAHERLERLAEAVRRVSAKAHASLVGSKVEVLVEGPSKRGEGILVGHSPENFTVHFPLPEGARAEELAGSIVDVEVKDARSFYVQGEIAGEAR